MTTEQYIAAAPIIRQIADIQDQINIWQGAEKFADTTVMVMMAEKKGSYYVKLEHVGFDFLKRATLGYLREQLEDLKMQLEKI